MSLSALLLFASVVFIGGLLAWNAWQLAHREDWIARVTNTHATAYSRLAEYAFWSLRHLIAAFTEPSGRRRRLSRAFLCMGMFALVLTPIVIAAQAANLEEVAAHPVAFAIGTAAWSVVVESPSLPYRVQIHAPDSRLVPPIAAAAIVATLDLTIGIIALAGTAADDAEAFATGAAFVAAGDLISGLVGLTTASMREYPFKDPAGPASEVKDADDPKPPSGTMQGDETGTFLSSRLRSRLPCWLRRHKRLPKEHDGAGRRPPRRKNRLRD